MTQKRHKVLIIAGGGVFGCIPAHFLAMLGNDKQTLLGIDALSGCSIGGILAAAYATGKTFKHVDYIFQRDAHKCFSKRFMAKLNPLACPTYDNDDIDEVLEDMIGDVKLGQVRDIYPQLSLIIPTLNITDDKYKVFDNIDHQDDDIPLKLLAGITSAAPTYYSGREYKCKCYIDGGLIEVAPLITATTALRAKKGIEFKDMDVLMLGTGKDIDERPLSTKDYNGLTLLGMATDVIVPYVTLSNEMATRYWGQHLGYGSFTYYNPCIINGKLDDVDQIPSCISQCNDKKAEFLHIWSKFMAD